MTKLQQLGMEVSNALQAVTALEKWIPGALTHKYISKICDTIRKIDDAAMDKHFPKSQVHPTMQKNLDNIFPGVRDKLTDKNFLSIKKLCSICKTEPVTKHPEYCEECRAEMIKDRRRG